MSLVGTRPPTVDEWEQYELHHRSRMSTKPGIDRCVQTRRIFYNPMWNYINDFSNPHGTYYLDSNS